MKIQVIAAAIAAAIAFIAGAQSRGPAMEAVVTVTNVDPLTRTVRVRTPKGETPVSLPPDVNVQDIRPGTRYRVRYSEPVVVALAPGAQPAASGGATAVVEPAPSGGAQGVKVERVAGVVEAIDPASRRISVRTLDGRSLTLAVAEDAIVAAPVKPGDAVTLSYHQAIATQMVSTPQPERDPAPAP
jgi:hypothetical protein